MKCSFLTFFFVLIFSNTHAQDTTNIYGEWKVCYQLKLNLDEECLTNTYVTYHFHDDGTYSDSRHYIINNKKYPYHGKWSFNNDVLIIDPEDENGIKMKPKVNNIKWINKNLFYTEGKEGKNGPKVYTYFKRL